MQQKEKLLSRMKVLREGCETFLRSQDPRDDDIRTLAELLSYMKELLKAEANQREEKRRKEEVCLKEEEERVKKEKATALTALNDPKHSSTTSDWVSRAPLEQET